MLIKKLFERMTREQRKKACACKSKEEFLAFAKKERIELSDDQLEAISGGGHWSDRATDWARDLVNSGQFCPNCFGNNISDPNPNAAPGKRYKCGDCGHLFGD